MQQRAPKDRIREQLDAELHEPGFRRRYDAIRRPRPGLKHYPTAQVLLDFLWDSAARDYARKDACLYALIQTFRASPSLRSSAFRLLLLAMWPGLEHIYYRHLPQSRAAGDLFSEIYWAFLQEIEGWRLSKSDKIAVNLQMNTQKRLRKVLGLGRKQLPLLDDVQEAARNRHYGARSSMPPEEPAESSRRGLLDTVAELVDKGVSREEDVTMVVRHAAYGVSLHDLAEEHGVPYKTACKRYERAVSRIRPHLEEI